MRSRLFPVVFMVALATGISVAPGCDSNVGLGGIIARPSGTAPTSAKAQAERGALTVSIGGDFSVLRSIQATIADIDHVTIGVTASGSAEVSKTLTRTQLADGATSASATFDSLAIGPASVSVKVYDAASSVIGSTAGAADIIVAQTAVLNLSLQLNPTYVIASGSLVASVSITDGPIVYVSPSPSPTATPSAYSVTTYAGTSLGYQDGSLQEAKFNQPAGLAVDATGTIYVSEYGGNRIRKIQDGVVSTLAGSGQDGHSDGQGTAASFLHPQGLAVDSHGFVYVADRINCLIRKISPAGQVTTVAGTYGSGFVDGASSSAKFSSPTNLAVDASGNVYVSDSGNYCIRKITSSGVVSTVAGVGQSWLRDGIGTDAGFLSPAGLVLGTNGTLFVGDSGIRTVIPVSREVTTIAGGPGSGGFADGVGSQVKLRTPSSLAQLPNGTIVFADPLNHAIRMLTPQGAVTTIAGTGSQGSLDGTGDVASFSDPEAVAVDKQGRLLVADTGNCRIRLISGLPSN